ncbi:MAG: sulfatase [Solirubrobacterales bacterium]
MKSIVSRRQVEMERTLMYQRFVPDRNLTGKVVLRLLLAALALTVWALLVAGPAARADAAKAGQSRPNIVLIEVDDAVVGDLEFMPNVKRLTERGGTTFSNYFVSYSLCCTARTTLLTGQFSHNHQVLSNFRANSGGYYTFRDLPGKLNQRNSLAPWLQRAGYRTGLIGKYLNEYGALDRTEVPPGWSRWVGLLDNSTYDYYNYVLNIDGRLRYYGDPDYAEVQLDLATRLVNDPPESFPELLAAFRSIFDPFDYFGWQREEDYTMDVGGAFAADFVRNSAPSRKPFFLYYSPPGPHAEDTNHLQGLRPGAPGPDPRPPARYRDTFDDVPLPRPPSFNEADVSDKAVNLSGLPLLTEPQIAEITDNYRGRLGAVRAVDDQVGRIASEVRRAGEMNNTYFIFTSDNGYLQGEHRLRGSKFLPYENSIRVPTLISGPGVKKGQIRIGNAIDVDLAPTILDMANVKPGRVMDGASLLPAAENRRRIPRRAVLLQAMRPLLRFYTPLTAFDQPFYGVRYQGFKYLNWSFDATELYNLREDPDELVNLAADPAYAATAARLEGLAKRLSTCSGKACR